MAAGKIDGDAGRVVGAGRLRPAGQGPALSGQRVLRCPTSVSALPGQGLRYPHGRPALPVRQSHVTGEACLAAVGTCDAASRSRPKMIGQIPSSMVEWRALTSAAQQRSVAAARAILPDVLRLA